MATEVARSCAQVRDPDLVGVTVTNPKFPVPTISVCVREDEADVIVSFSLIGAADDNML
jgi:hypothetical protein